MGQFFAITIRMHYSDHKPAHYHATYAGEEVRVGISDLQLLSATLPRRAWVMVLESAALYRLPPREHWERAWASEPLSANEPPEPLPVSVEPHPMHATAALEPVPEYFAGPTTGHYRTARPVLSEALR